MKLFSMQTSIRLIAIGMLSTAVLFSCKKENKQDTATITENDATMYSADAMETDASYDDIQDLSMTAAEEEGAESARSGDAGRDPISVYVFAQLRLRIGNNATVTVAPLDGSFPKTVTIDFGASGSVGLDGKFRKGKIVLHYTAPIRESGAVLTVTLVDYKVGRLSIEGTKVITNLSTGGNIKYSVQVTDGKVTFPNGRGYAYQKMKYVTQTAGSATTQLSDDVFQLEGSSQTNFNNGVVVKLNTQTALVKKLSCPWISAGTLNIKVNDFSLALDYAYPSNGDCDNKALLSWNAGASTRIIVLP